MLFGKPQLARCRACCTFAGPKCMYNIGPAVNATLGHSTGIEPAILVRCSHAPILYRVSRKKRYGNSTGCRAS
jgi:hypothetical protein